MFWRLTRRAPNWADQRRRLPVRSDRALQPNSTSTRWRGFCSSAGAQSFVSESRRRRIEATLDLLRRQPYLKANAGHSRSDPLESCVFNDCEAAMVALRTRLPAMLELVKALAIAELEIEGRYVDSEHDDFFASFDESRWARPISRSFRTFSSVCVWRRGASAAKAEIMATLSSGLPIKIFAQIDDLLGDARSGEKAFGLAVARLGTMAVALDDVYVLQAGAANLYALRDRVHRGMTFGGAALFSIFAGRDGNGLPCYLSSAAATQSRTFPAFSYDPAAGSDLASQFRLEENPQPEKDWSTHRSSIRGRGTSARVGHARLYVC